MRERGHVLGALDWLSFDFLETVKVWGHVWRGIVGVKVTEHA